MIKTNSKNTQKQKWFPNVYTLLVLLALFAMIMTWLVPAGQFERIIEDDVTKVVPNSFKYVDKSVQNPWDVIQAIVQGFKNQVSLIMMIIFVGAAVQILEGTEAINKIFLKLANRIKGKEGLTIFVVMLFMTIGGATGVFGNVTLVLIPIGIFLSEAMGFDKTLGFFMIFLGSFSGFSVGWANAGVLGLAQTIAELPMFSGMKVRMLLHLINFLLSYGFVMYYFKQIKNNPQRSLNYSSGLEVNEYMGTYEKNTDTEIKVSNKNILSVFTLAFGIFAIVMGAIKYGWAADKMSATFIVVGIVIGFINYKDPNEVFNHFIKGCSNMIKAAFIVGFANAITIVLNNGLILDTVVNFLAGPVNRYGNVIGANLMYFVNILINFFISSGSGQASAVIPIMTPIADLTGITRQIAVQAFQFGDGITNIIVPTVGTLMGGLGFANVGYGKYVKRVMPLLIAQLIFGMIAITILQMVGWTGI